jgi:DNA polymerase III epsilon subunit-like protein
VASMKTIVVFDLETGSVDTKRCELVEIACIALDGFTLKPIAGSEFVSLVKPLDFSNLQPEALKVNGKTPDELRTAPDRKAVLKRFSEHVKQFNAKGALGKPFAAGKNIRAFDLPILDRVMAEDGLGTPGGRQTCFDLRTQIDVEDDLLRFFGHVDVMPNMKMDTVRNYFGMSKERAHEAMTDVWQTAWLVRQFFGLYRRTAMKTKFENSAAASGGLLKCKTAAELAAEAAAQTDDSPATPPTGVFLSRSSNPWSLGSGPSAPRPL